MEPYMRIQTPVPILQCNHLGLQQRHVGSETHHIMHTYAALSRPKRPVVMLGAIATFVLETIEWAPKEES